MRGYYSDLSYYLSLLNTVYILDILVSKLAQLTGDNRIHEADRQRNSCRSPDHVSVDETVIRLNDERYRLWATVDPETNE